MKTYKIETRRALLALSALLAFGALAPTASAQYYPNDPRIERYSDYARQGVGIVYGEAGRRMCGPACAYGGRRVGEGIYDRSQRFSRHYGQRLQEFGRDYVRPRLNRRR